jgi:lipopolysaccharide biosynthesis glycosyltransferase
MPPAPRRASSICCSSPRPPLLPLLATLSLLLVLAVSLSLLSLTLSASLVGLGADVDDAPPPSPHAGGSSVERFVGRLRRQLTGGPGGALLRRRAPAQVEPSASPPNSPSSPSSCDPHGDNAGAPVDPHPITLVYTACGNPNEVEEDHFGLVSLKSLLMAKDQRGVGNAGRGPRRYAVHVLTNVGESELLNSTHVNHDVWRAIQRDPSVTIRVHNIDLLDEATRQAGVGEPSGVPQTMFKNCAASRLKLPFLLARAGVKRAIYMDWDTISLCDLSTLWDEFGRFSDSAFMGFAPADPTGASELDHYRMWDLPRHPVYGSVNSGVMLLDVEKVMTRLGGAAEPGTRRNRTRAADAPPAPSPGPPPSPTDPLRRTYWSELSAIIAEKVPNVSTASFWDLTNAFPLGDQDVLNELFERQPGWLHPLPERYNHCLDIDTEVMPCVLHYCGNKLMPTQRGERTLPIEHPWKASYMFVKNWPLVPFAEPPGPT